jgi:hypothetical protein
VRWESAPCLPRRVPSVVVIPKRLCDGPVDYSQIIDTALIVHREAYAEVAADILLAQPEPWADTSNNPIWNPPGREQVRPEVNGPQYLRHLQKGNHLLFGKDIPAVGPISLCSPKVSQGDVAHIDIGETEVRDAVEEVPPQ